MSPPRNRRRGGGRANDIVGGVGGGSPRTTGAQQWQVDRHDDFDEMAFHQSQSRHRMQRIQESTGRGMCVVRGLPFDDEDDYPDDFE